MFSKISWSCFITAVLVLVIVYYIVIGILYFRGDVVRLLKEGINRKTRKMPEPLSMPGACEKKDAVLFPAVHELMDELKEVFFTAASKHYPEEELVTALQSTLKRYINLKDTQFEAAINNHIQQSGLSMCNISLDESHLKRIW